MNISSHHTPIYFNQSAHGLKNRAENSSQDNHVSGSDKKDADGNKIDESKFQNNTKKFESELNQQQLNQLRELRQRDREVRAHEQAHAAVAGSLAKGGPSYSYERGPDGQLYAVGGEVHIDTSAVAGDPKATAEKARQVRRAALAPAQPSQQDRAIAAAAAALEAQARVEIAQQNIEDTEEVLNTHFNNQDKDTVNKDHVMEETLNYEVQTNCAQCGGQHSAESHSVAITLGETFNHENQIGQSKSLLDTTI